MDTIVKSVVINEVKVIWGKSIFCHIQKMGKMN